MLCSKVRANIENYIDNQAALKIKTNMLMDICDAGNAQICAS
jgi:hypothetical protein